MSRPDAMEFRDLVLAELSAVHRMALHLCRDRNAADDLVQEAYLRAFRSAGTYKPSEAGPRPWLFKILHNVWKSRLAKGSNDPAKPTGAEADELAATLAAPPPTPPDDLDWDQCDERLKKAIDELPDNYRGVLLLWAVEGMKYREIADVTDIPIGTVMSRLFRARQLLTESLAELAQERRLVSEVSSQ